MATALLPIDRPVDHPLPTGAMVVAEPATGTIVLLDREKFEPFYDAIADEARAYQVDTSTAKGREAARSFVFQNITKVRTGLEKQANDLTEEWRRNTASVVSARKEITDRFKALAVETLAPLTAWEEAEKARVAECEAILAKLRTSATVTFDETSEQIWARGLEIRDTVIDPEKFGDRYEEALDDKKTAGRTLFASYEQVKAREEQAAELARLRAAEAERQEREAEAQCERDRIAAEEQVERDRVAAEEQAERDRIAAREAEQARIAEAAAQAEERARQAAERAREEERARERAEHDRLLAEERAARERVEREAAEREAAAQADRDAEAARQRRTEQEAAAAAEVERKRQANRAHRSVIQREVKEALMTCGVTEEHARLIVVAIVSGNIPHTEVKF